MQNDTIQTNDRAPDKINIRGIPVDNVTLEEAFAAVLDFTKTDTFHTVCTPNAEIVQQCVEDEAMADLVRRADLIIPDGAGVVLASKILGTPLKAKTPGCELGERIVRASGAHGLRVYFLGGKPGVAALAAQKLQEKYPDFTPAGMHDGYFEKTGAENDAVLAEINAAAPDVLFVCFGVPAQEKWIDANREKLPSVRVALGLGGSLDSYAGTVKRAPRIFIRLNLEWFYRLCCQPSRIGRMMKLPKFIFGTLLLRLRGRQ
ncbi:MAG: WecB/TagA/CpsF family glycosyltransferase [Clostridia bacterium]|nr:WecB/TagA/CpsF family glycosyltransferase [Clostridia bacterium]